MFRFRKNKKDFDKAMGKLQDISNMLDEKIAEEEEKQRKLDSLVKEIEKIKKEYGLK